jgi:hypothetical protein
MLFFFKPKVVTLDFFTSQNHAFTYAKPQLANKFYPDWWRTLNTPNLKNIDRPNSVENLDIETTMRRCVGMSHLYKYGLVLPLWSDLRLYVGPIGSGHYRYLFSDGVTSASQHPDSQKGDFLPDTNYCHLKIHSPWIAYCSEAIPFMLSPLVWNMGKPEECIIPSGMTEYKYQHSTNINLFVPRKNEEQIVQLGFNTPMYHMVPLTDKKFEIKTHLVSQTEYDQKYDTSRNITFTGKYLNHKKILTGK